MLQGKRIVVVLPAYRAVKTLERTCQDVPKDIVDEILLVDDASDDATASLATSLGIRTFAHQHNLGYGANQKTCYREALRLGADIVVMLHPDYQYDPRLITPMAGMIACDVYDVVLGSRILGGTALKGNMPLYKYVCNRLLTGIQNLLVGAKLSEYHTGYRAFSRKVIEELPLLGNSDEFLFDNQMITQAVAFDFRIGEISCPTRYFAEASSINFGRSVVYGLGVLFTSFLFRLWRWRLLRPRLFSKRPTLRLIPDYYQSLPEDAGARSDARRQG
jgi:glycosyltransferase involved in cell wall biosynthesis